MLSNRPHEETQYPSNKKAYWFQSPQFVSFADTFRARCVWVEHCINELSRFEVMVGPNPHGFGERHGTCIPHSYKLLCLHSGNRVWFVSRNLHPVVYLSLSHSLTIDIFLSHLFFKIATHSDVNQLLDQALSLEPSHAPHWIGARNRRISRWFEIIIHQHLLSKTHVIELVSNTPPKSSHLHTTSIIPKWGRWPC